MSNVKAIPEGYHSVTPYLNLRNAAKAVEFYKKAFGATEVGILTMGDKIAHGELQIGNSRIMISDEMPDWGNLAPETIGGTPVGLCIYVEDVDAVYKRAVEAGAKELPGMEVKDQFYGDRSGSIIDPFGHKWTIATHIRDVSWEEMQKQSDAMMAQQAQ